MHQNLLAALRHYISDLWLPYAIFAINTASSISTGYSAYELLFGRSPNIPGTLQQKSIDTNYNYDDYLKTFQKMLQRYYDLARYNVKQAQIKSKEKYNKSANE